MYKKQSSIPSSRRRKAKRLSEVALQIAEREKKQKAKRENESYIQLNAEFQTIARRDKRSS